MGIVCSYRVGSGRSHDRACVFVSLCPTSLRSVSRSQKRRTQTEGRTRSMKNRSGRVPRSPRASQNRAKIVNKSVRGAFGAILDDSGRLQDGPGTLQRRSGTLSGRPGTSRDAPGTLPGDLRDAPGTLSGRSGTLLGRLRDGSGPLWRANCSRNRLRIESGSFFRRFFEVFSLISRIVFRSCFPQFFDRFSIGLRPFFDRSPCRESCERLLPNIDFCAHGQCFGRFFQIRASSSDRKTMSGATENRLPN